MQVGVLCLALSLRSSGQTLHPRPVSGSPLLIRPSWGSGHCPGLVMPMSEGAHLPPTAPSTRTPRSHLPLRQLSSTWSAGGAGGTLLGWGPSSREDPSSGGRRSSLARQDHRSPSPALFLAPGGESSFQTPCACGSRAGTAGSVGPSGPGPRVAWVLPHLWCVKFPEGLQCVAVTLSQAACFREGPELARLSRSGRNQGNRAGSAVVSGSERHDERPLVLQQTSFTETFICTLI